MRSRDKRRADVLFKVLPRVYDGTHRINAKDEMSALPWETVKKNDLVLVESYLVRHVRFGGWGVGFKLRSVVLLSKSKPKEEK